MTMGTLLIMIAVLLFIQGFFAAAELSLISSDRIALERQAQAGNRRARLALNMLERPDRILATTLLGTNLCVAVSAAVATTFAFNTLGEESESLVVMFLSPLALVLGELIPKTLGQRYAEKISPTLAPILRFAQTLFKPLIWVVGKYTDWLSRKLHPIETLITGANPPSHRDELRYLLSHGQKETSLKTSERKMIRRIFDFSRAEAKRALIPLIRIDMLEDTSTVKDALEAFSRFKHSRLPVYKDRVDNVIGVLHLFDVYLETDHTKSISQVMRPAFYVPETQQLEQLLFTLQKRGIQLAIVVDEYGGATGIVTLEDILEEIVGDIQDEYDNETALYRELGPSEYLVQGQMTIGSLAERLKIHVPKGSYETLAGFLLQQFNRIPEEGDELYFKGMKFVIRKASERAIKQVVINTDIATETE